MSLLTDLVAKQSQLLAQCPLSPNIVDRDASRLPIHVERVGLTGPLVLIIHGGVQGALGGSPETFAEQHVLAERGWRLALPERPGFGRSPSRGADDMEADAVWIADLMQDDTHLIGHSWGGGAVLLAAARRPEVVRSLILVEPALQGLIAAHPELASAGLFARMSMMNVLMAARTPRDYALGCARYLGMSGPAGHEPDDETLTRLGCAFLRARMAAPASLRRAAETVAMAKIPVLVISGGYNPEIDEVARIVAQVTLGRHAKVPSPNHLPMRENPAAFNAVVDGFMRNNENARWAA